MTRVIKSARQPELLRVAERPVEFRALQLSPAMLAVEARCTTPRQIVAGSSRVSLLEEAARIRDRIDNWRRKP